MDHKVENIGLRFGFAGAIVVAFGALLGYAAVDPQALAIPVVGAIPLSLVLAAVLIVFAMATTGAYVLIANRLGEERR
jgi:uncharacterized membrane protein (DUF485 family)